MYYAPLLFERLGIQGDMDAAWVTVGLGVAKVSCSFRMCIAGHVSFSLVDICVLM